MRWLRALVIAVFALGFGLVIFSTAVYPAFDWKLGGVENSQSFPKLTVRSWFCGKFASAVETFLTGHFGVRGILIRCGNQARYSLFHSYPDKRSSAVFIGRNNWLYEREYLRYYTKRFSMQRTEAERFAAEVKKLQESLARMSIPLVILISPSKPEIYPENMPLGMEPSENAKASENKREIMLKALAATSVSTVDANSLFCSWRTDGIALFPRTGTHWTSYGAQRILDEVWKAARRQEAGAVLPLLPEVISHRMTRPFGADEDLKKLLNLLYFDKAEGVPYPVLNQPAPPTERLKALLIGDSFAFQLVDAMGRTGFFSKVKLIYYFRTFYDFSWEADEKPKFNLPDDCRGEAVNQASLDWVALLADVDIVVIEFNEIFSGAAAWGAPQSANRRLSAK